MKRPLFIDDYGGEVPLQSATKTPPIKHLRFVGRRWKISEDGETARLIELRKVYGILEILRVEHEDVIDGPVVPVVWSGNDPRIVEEE